MTPNRGLVTVSPGRAELVDLPYPTLPRDDYIIVKGTAFAVNPSDHAHIDMTDEQSCAGCHVGCDYAGVVVEVGPGVTKDFKKGDRIAGAANGG